MTDSLNVVLTDLSNALARLGLPPTATPAHTTRSELVDALENSIGHEPHPDLVTWYEFTQTHPQDIHPLVSTIGIEDLSEIYTHWAERTVLDQHGLLLHQSPAPDTMDGFSTANFDFVPIQQDHTGELIGLNPTTPTGDPRIVVIGEIDLYFSPLPPVDNPYIETPLIHSRDQLPTLIEWLATITADLNSNLITLDNDDSNDSNPPRRLKYHKPWTRT